MGHELRSLTYGLYSEGLSLDRLKTVVEAVKYPDLDLSHLYPAPKERKGAKPDWDTQARATTGRGPAPPMLECGSCHG